MGEDSGTQGAGEDRSAGLGLTLLIIAVLLGLIGYLASQYAPETGAGSDDADDGIVVASGEGAAGAQEEELPPEPDADTEEAAADGDAGAAEGAAEVEPEGSGETGSSSAGEDEGSADSGDASDGAETDDAGADTASDQASDGGTGDGSGQAASDDGAANDAGESNDAAALDEGAEESAAAEDADGADAGAEDADAGAGDADDGGAAAVAEGAAAGDASGDTVEDAQDSADGDAGEETAENDTASGEDNAGAGEDATNESGADDANGNDAGEGTVEDGEAEGGDGTKGVESDETELALLAEDPPADPPATPPTDVSESAPDAPRFDVIRIDESGSGLVAGRAAPGSTVRVMAGGTELATAEVAANGQFVAFIQTPDRNEGQTLSLVALNGATEEGSREDILILPVETEDETPVAPAIVARSQDNVRLVQPSGLGRVDGVTLDSISYDRDGAVLLTGRAPGAQPIRIYVDGAATGAAQAAEDGTWSTRIEGIAEGRYVLRVDALNADGSVATRAESPFQRVFPTAAQRANPTQITVQPGNTLWVMARERYGSGLLYTQIYAANQNAIRDPDLIYPGQIFEIPDEKDFTQ